MGSFNVELRRNTGADYGDIYYLKTIPSMVEGLLTNGKISDGLLPNYVFGGMRFVNAIQPYSDTADDTTGELDTQLNTYILVNGGSKRGCFFILSGGVGVLPGTITVSTGHTVYVPTSEDIEGVVFEGGTFVLGVGDWIICTSDDGTIWSVVNNTYELATTSLAGLMSASDKIKLNGIATGANLYEHPTQSAIDGNAADDGISVIDRIQVNTLGHVTAVSTRNLSAATPSTPGHMTAADKTKLDAIATGANLYVHPTDGANVSRDLTTVETIDVITVNSLGHVTTVTKQAIREATSELTGLVELATVAEMKAGTDGTRVGSAAGVKAAIDFFATLPVYASLTAANADAGNQPVGKLALVIV